MSEITRDSAIAALSATRGERPLLTYVTSSRPNLATVVAPDVFGIIYEHLHRIANPAKLPELDVFVMTYGGDTTVPLPLVNLMREYATRVNVLVAAECFSAGTMIALGADSIIMTPLGQLTPVDPSVGHPLNPQSPTPQFIAPGVMGQPVIQVAVEQVFSYLSLATDKAKLTNQDARARAFERLANSVHPIALGEIHRTHSLIRVLAEKLLLLHMTDRRRIDKIVAALTEKLFNHAYRIARMEARQLGLDVESAAPSVEQAMMDLRREYIADAKMGEPFDIDAEIQRIRGPGLPGIPSGPPMPTPGPPVIGPSATPSPTQQALGSGLAAAGGAAQAQPSAFPVNVVNVAAFIGSSVGESSFVYEHTVNLNPQAGMPNMQVSPYNVRQTSAKWISRWK